MNRRIFDLAVLALAGALIAPASWAQATGEQDPSPQIEDLGEQRYRIGAIEIDQATSSFTVSGEIVRDTPPLEFLVTTKGGYKSYESVMEVNADAYQFNLACILIGLDASKATPPGQRDFDQPVAGDPVVVTFSWTENGKRRQAKASHFLLQGDPPRVVKSNAWVYTGSVMLPDGQYVAHIAGTLLGFAHKSESIIEHRMGMGDGVYGSILVNTGLVPAVGSAIEMTIKRPR